MKKFLVGILAALTCFAFVACAPNTVEDAKTKMEEAGYTVIVSGEAAAELIAGETAVDMLTATKSSGGLTNLKIDNVSAIFFESSSAAKEYYESVKDDKDEDEVAKQDGKWVYVGTETAIADFTK